MILISDIKGKKKEMRILNGTINSVVLNFRERLLKMNEKIQVDCFRTFLMLCIEGQYLIVTFDVENTM